MTAHRFFETAIPFFIFRSMFAFIVTRGRIHFEVEGEGSWTLELGNVGEPVLRGLVGMPDLEVWFSSTAFESFVSGTLNPKPALQRGEFRVKGDVRLLENLGAILTPPKRGFRQRIALA
jgi:SCP-2 sterol transfer family protein